jgi:hypothetical protein
VAHYLWDNVCCKPASTLSSVYSYLRLSTLPQCCLPQNFFPVVKHGPSIEALKEGWPFPVACCWNGLIVLNAAPFRCGVWGGGVQKWLLSRTLNEAPAIQPDVYTPESSAPLLTCAGSMALLSVHKWKGNALHR